MKTWLLAWLALCCTRLAQQQAGGGPVAYTLWMLFSACTWGCFMEVSPSVGVTSFRSVLKPHLHRKNFPDYYLKYHSLTLVLFFFIAVTISLNYLFINTLYSILFSILWLLQLKKKFCGDPLTLPIIWPSLLLFTFYFTVCSPAFPYQVLT